MHIQQVVQNEAQAYEPRRHSDTSSIKACQVGIVSWKKNRLKGLLIYKHFLFQEQLRYVCTRMYAYLRTHVYVCMAIHACVSGNECVCVCMKTSLKTRGLHRHLGED